MAWHKGVAIALGLLALSSCKLSRSSVRPLSGQSDAAAVDAARNDSGTTETDAGTDSALPIDAETPDACESAVEACNNIDDDCDSVVDEALTRSCGASMGICMPGTETCVAGSWGECVGAVGPATESCSDAGDEDCDGNVDEGCVCSPTTVRSCQRGGCSGAQTCMADGTWGNCVTLSAGAELCDGIDNDCNGVIDNGADCSTDAECQLAFFRESTYLLCSDNPGSWGDARAHCESFGYDLVTIDDQEEMDWLESMTQDDDEWWIGLFDENGDGVYEPDEWVGGTSSYTNWQSGQPNGTSDCVKYNSNDGEWDDKGCGGSRSFICEVP